MPLTVAFLGRSFQPQLSSVMHPAESVATFQNAIAASGAVLDELNAEQALTQVLAFYRDVRAEGCDQDEEEDTLIWKWGMYVQGREPSFQVELIRCFIEPGTEDEDGMSQLSLTLRYTPSDALQSLGRGSYWCGSPAESQAFESAVLASPAYHAVLPLKPGSAELEWCLE